jgi:hypothetical protein
MMLFLEVPTPQPASQCYVFGLDGPTLPLTVILFQGAKVRTDTVHRATNKIG